MTRFRVLFVGIGNACRSPLGERLLAVVPAESAPGTLVRTAAVERIAKGLGS